MSSKKPRHMARSHKKSQENPVFNLSDLSSLSGLI